MNGLETVQLGNSRLRITRVGIGTAPIGSTTSWHVYWGPQDEKVAIRAIQRALDLGVNWIDTAPFYGWGRAEEVVGRAVKGRRDEVYIFTKCGTLPDGKGGDVEDNSAETIKQEVDQSLRRLGMDYLDLLQIHDPDPSTSIEESWRAVQDLVGEGKVRYGGLSNHPVSLVRRAMKTGPVVSNQLQYNPLERRIEEEHMQFCQENRIGILGWGSLAEGFLADNFDLSVLDPNDFRRRHKYGQAQNYDLIMKVREALKRVAVRHGKSMVDVVIAWELMHPALTAAIIGIRDENEAERMMAGSKLHLTKEDMDEIEKALATWNA